MGVATAWRFSGISANLALLELQNGSVLSYKNVCWRWRSSGAQQSKQISWSLVCDLMLFCLGVISLFTGHVASDLDWMKVIKKRLIYGNLKMQNISMDAAKEVSNFLISDAVAVARILNATLVVPQSDHNSYWKDNSNFVNISDVNWFISYLVNDVTIVKKVPDNFMRSMEKHLYTMRVPRKSPPEYYLDQVLPILKRRHVLQLTKFDYRLANDIDEELQNLVGRANFHALRFTKPIEELGQKLVMRMREMAKHFMAVHLRGQGEIRAWRDAKRWETLTDLDADGAGRRGKCPLTPQEVGLMLQALGFANDTNIYVASEEIYGGEETLRPLRNLFPNFYTKERLADEELKPFLPFSSRLAAIDDIVCDESDVFVTNNNGNMAKILAGRRRYMGHKRTIRLNARRLCPLLMKRDKMDWDTFLKEVQRGFMGEPNEMKTGRGEFHEYPYSCICEKPLSDVVDNKRGDPPPEQEEIND